MSDSLKDQLLALGLAKARPEKPKQHSRGKPPGSGAPGKGDKPARHGKPVAKNRGGAKAVNAASKPGGELSLDAAWRARERDEKKAAEDKAAAKRAEDLRRRQVNAEVEALVKDQALNDREGELKRNFLYKGRIRSVRVNATQLAALNAGELGLVFLRGDYLLLPPELVAKVQALSPEHVPDLSGADTGEEAGGDYPPVPDDLVW